VSFFLGKTEAFSIAFLVDFRVWPFSPITPSPTPHPPAFTGAGSIPSPEWRRIQPPLRRSNFLSMPLGLTRLNFRRVGVPTTVRNAIRQRQQHA
jgi:hypothetical protein